MSIVAILTGNSLLAEGVISRLRQHPDQLDLRVIETTNPCAIKQIIDIQPSTVILDDSDPIVAQQSLIDTLLTNIPSLTLIRLDPQSTQIQVVHWEEHRVSKVRDLLEVL